MIYNNQTFTYDEIGNPLTYRDGMSFTWQAGRQLKSVTFPAATSSMIYTATYKYNKDGLMIEKVLTNNQNSSKTVYTYEYQGSQLIRQTVNDIVYWFLYDESGSPIGLTENGTVYYYVKNLQGDIVAITNAEGTICSQREFLRNSLERTFHVLPTNGPLRT